MQKEKKTMDTGSKQPCGSPSAQRYFRCGDTEALIDLKRKVNMVDSFNDGISVTKTEVNPETIVANQLAMYIRAYNFEDASILADKLPDTERFQMIKAFATASADIMIIGAPPP